MGLFSTTLHIYKKDQSEIIDNLKKVLIEQKLKTFSKIEVTSDSFHNVLKSEVNGNSGVFYLITERFDNWTTIVELNVYLDEPFYLYELANALSDKLGTYTLSLHLHDDDVLLYNLEHMGMSVDGYNSNVQYFENEPLSKTAIIAQRHEPEKFFEILPPNKSSDGLNEILNRGYWQAFDNDDLDADGIPNDDKYDAIEEDRLTEIAKYLEIFSAENFPFANWYDEVPKLDLTKYYLLRADF